MAIPHAGGTQWSLADAKLAFYVYCQLPFGKLHQSNPEIRRLARAIGRTPGSAAMKLVNFASLDPAVRDSGRTGLGNVSRLDREVWEQFQRNWEALALESELRLRAADDPLREQSDPDPTLTDYGGATRETPVQVRIGQQFFRRSVLASYGSRCCMSGLSEPRLLVASHIKPWNVDANNRLNPKNGLCLSSIHDKAFDAGLLTLDAELRVSLSGSLRGSEDELVKNVFLPIDGKSIQLPERFHPDPEFITYHRRCVFVDAPAKR